MQTKLRPYGCEYVKWLGEATGLEDLSNTAVIAPSESYALIWGHRDMEMNDAAGCKRMTNPMLKMYHLVCLTVALILLISSWALQRAYRKKAASEEEESGSTGIIMAEAVLAVLQTLSTFLLLDWNSHTSQSFTKGIIISGWL